MSFFGGFPCGMAVGVHVDDGIYQTSAFEQPLLSRGAGSIMAEGRGASLGCESVARSP